MRRGGSTTMKTMAALVAILTAAVRTSSIAPFFAEAQTTTTTTPPPAAATTLAPLAPVSYAPTTFASSSSSTPPATTAAADDATTTTMTPTTATISNATFPPSPPPGPTSSPSDAPSETPTTPFPSASPSTSETSTVTRRCSQNLEVEEAQTFNDVQIQIYQLLMQSYTANLVHGVVDPYIKTICTITDQEVAGGNPDGGRRVERSWSGGFLRRALRRRSLFGWERDDDDDDDDDDVHHDDFDKDGGPGGGGGGGASTSTSAARRRPGRDLQATRNLIVMSFTMTYETRYGYDISEYPFLFSNHIITNIENVTLDMQLRFLPVMNAGEVIVYNPDPSAAPSPVPTGGAPTAAPASAAPTSASPTAAVPGLITDKPSFVVGLAAGLTFAGALVLFVMGYACVQRRRERRRKKEGGGPRGVAKPEGSFREGGEGIEVAYDGGGGGMGVMSFEDDELRNISSLAGGSSTQYFAGDGRRRGTDDDHDDVDLLSSPLSNPSMVSEGGGSFSSLPDDYYPDGGGGKGGGVRVDALQDEFDQYKNEDLEHMRNGVEGSVYGSEGMMSLAMTRALMDDEDADVHPSWGEAEDPESIVANALCETNDWVRKNEFTTLEERNIFFQELLNRMVITVRRGMASPPTGTLAIHCCAAMLGLQLEKDLPNNVLLVHGMRKINDISLGRKYLVDTFRSFGDIEAAAIAPCNRGFGFVRFVSPKSVQRALELFKISEIEVQDVSVMIKALKADAPAE